MTTPYKDYEEATRAIYAEAIYERIVVSIILPIVFLVAMYFCMKSIDEDQKEKAEAALSSSSVVISSSSMQETPINY